MSEAAKDHPFQPGVEVALVSRSIWSGSVSFSEHKIAKVYASGNFVLESGSQQYRPVHGRFGDDRWFGRPTGKGYNGGDTVEFITDELRTEVAAYERRSAFLDAVETLRRLRDYEVTCDQLARLNALVEELEPKKP